MTTLLKLILLTSCPTLALLATVAHGVQSVTLAWGPVSTATGYKIYWGTQSNALSSSLSVGAVTNATVSGLVEGTQYWFGATALSNTLESVMSLEIAYTVPTTNVYVTNFILAPWYQPQYGPALKGTNWANFGAAFKGQFTSLPSAFLRFLWLSNQVVGFTILTNPPPDTGSVMMARPPNPMGVMK